MERTLGRLLTDADFRRHFFRNPARACLEVGFQLSAHEMDALLQVPARGLASLAGQLDDRICRLEIEAPDPDGTRQGSPTHDDDE
ncbi:MAG TPA: Franean1_4349 family RiPP [Gaiellales bacterium]|nr:Franean1_4349 family RiPP [Gaiellales bacterium]